MFATNQECIYLNISFHFAWFYAFQIPKRCHNSPERLHMQCCMAVCRASFIRKNTLEIPYNKEIFRK